MALRLDPTRPLVWRTPFCLQVGVEPPVIVLDDLSPDDEIVIELLRAGVTPAMLDDAVVSHGWNPVRVAELLARVGPALCDRVPPPLAGHTIAIDGPPRDAATLHTLLGALGARVSVGAEVPCEPPCGVARSPAADTGCHALEPGAAWRATSGAGAGKRVAVVLSHYVVSPRAAGLWLRADVPHLLVRFGDRTIRVGPLVSPGRGPCATCLELHQTDRDEAWPALAAQLARRRAPSADAHGLAVLAPVVARILSSSGGGWATRVVRLPRLAVAEGLEPGEWLDELEPVSPHPRCGCLSPPGNATARELPTSATHRPPTRARAVPWPG